MNDFARSLFPVCVTAKIPVETIEAFLKKADASVKKAAGSLPRLFVLIRNLKDSSDAAQASPLSLSSLVLADFTSPFLGQTPKQICTALREKQQRHAPKIEPDLFAVLDAQSPEDGQALFCAGQGKRRTVNVVDSVRLPFAEAVCLNTVQVGCSSIPELGGIHNQDAEESEVHLQGRTSYPRKSKIAANARIKPPQSAAQSKKVTKKSLKTRPRKVLGRSFKDAKGKTVFTFSSGRTSKNRHVDASYLDTDTGKSVELVEELDL